MESVQSAAQFFGGQLLAVGMGRQRMKYASKGASNCLLQLFYTISWLLSYSIWGVPKIGVPLVIIHFTGIFSLNHPAIGVPPFMEPPIYLAGRSLFRSSQKRTTFHHKSTEPKMRGYTLQTHPGQPGMIRLGI